jgi:hypothetical protein
MYPQLVLGQITLVNCFEVTSIYHSFVLGLLVFCQSTLCNTSVVTMVTNIPYSFMIDKLMSGEITLLSSIVLTPVTAIIRSFMHFLIVLGQTTLLSIILIAHVTPEPAISLLDYWNCTALHCTALHCHCMLGILPISGVSHLPLLPNNGTSIGSRQNAMHYG